MTTGEHCELAAPLLQLSSVKDFAFAQASRPGLPRRKKLAITVAALFYIALLALVIRVKMHPTRVSSAGSPYGSMTAYVPGAIGGGAPAAPKPAAPKTNAVTANARTAPSEQTAVGTAGVAGSGQGGSGPVRLGAGGNLTLIKRVQPVYPPLLQQARVTGQVVLDAIIHPDGTIGDIKVLSSSNDQFAQSAIAAVRQWQYTAPGFEGILTVTVNFNFGA